MDNDNKKSLNVRLRSSSSNSKGLTKSSKSTNLKKTRRGEVTQSSNNPKDPKNNKKKKKNKKIGWKIFRVFLFVGLALCIVGAGIVLGVISGIVDDTDSISLDELELLSQTSFLYDMDGNEIGSLYDSENRILVDYEDIPEYTVNAIVAIEDERFFSHNGVDIKRTLAAVVTYIANSGDSDFGASTITQQLVKNITSDDEYSWKRKIREWYRAIVLETKLDKESILESYVNTIYYGDGCYGIEVASNHFFGKSVSELNLAESAAIAAMIQSPEITNPYKSDEAQEKLIERQQVVLEKMLSLGMITQDEYDEAISYELAFTSVDVTYSTTQSYFIDAVVEAVIDDLMEQKNVSRGIAMKMIYTDGYQIYTTQDQTVQAAIDSAFDNPNIFYTDYDGDFMQGAMVVIDQSTGEVRGLIGGADEKQGALTLNRATQTYRQPGSCMKPFGAYGPAFEAGTLSTDGGIDDTQVTYGTWTPVNWYGYYKGYVTVREAIEYSMNIPAVRACLSVGDIDYNWNFAYNCGLTSLVEADKTAASLALGGVTNGFSVLQMANAYATIANDGYYIEPKLYTLVLDRNGEVVLDNTAVDAKQVMSESTAFMLTSCLESVVSDTMGTAYGTVSIKNGTIQCTGKTGNTNDDYDRWFCGFTSYYTIACWTGYDTNKVIGRSSPYDATKLFNTVMNAICADKEASTLLDQPSSVVTVEVCRDSGLIATDACKNDPRGSRVITTYCDVDNVPTSECTVHETVKICNVSGLIASSACTSTTTKTVITRDYLPSQGTYSSDWSYMKPTSTCTTCSGGSSSNVVIYKNGVQQ